jgi:DNA-binding MarR family transcriptional regulator
VAADGSARSIRRRFRVTERDRALIEFASQHRLILPAHAQALLGMTAGTTATRLRAIVQAGLLQREPPQVHGRPGCFQVTTAGLGMIGSRLSKPRFELASFNHDVGLAWVHLAVKAGRFGPVREVFSEREMRSLDGRPGRAGPPLGVRLGGLGPGGRERLHYPDLLVRTETCHTVAIELELSGKERASRERILGGYGAEPRIDAVVYLSDKASIRRGIQTSARQLGISSLMHVQRFAWGDAGRPNAPARVRQQVRSAELSR